MKSNGKYWSALRRLFSDDPIVRITSGGRVHVDMERQLRTPEAQRIMKKIEEAFEQKTSADRERSKEGCR